MKWAMVFPGQGEPIERSLETWIRDSPHVRSRLEFATERLGLPLTGILERGGCQLRRTRVYQPVSTALSIGVLDAFVASGVAPSAVAGHSLGELPAACAAGFISPDNAIRTAVIRGGAMGREAERNPGGMVAVHTSDPATIRRALDSTGQRVVVAAWNGPGQTVLSGDTVALRRLPMAATPLFVEGAWHSPAMAGAVRELEENLLTVIAGSARIPMVFNRTGSVESDPALVPRLLAEQLVHPIRWTEVMATLSSQVEAVVTAGPARSLRGLIQDCLGSTVQLISAEYPDELDSCIERLAA